MLSERRLDQILQVANTLCERAQGGFRAADDLERAGKHDEADTVREKAQRDQVVAYGALRRYHEG